MLKVSQEKIQHAWSILCSGVSIDQQRNNLTLFNVIEQIKIPRNQLVEVKEDGQKKIAVPIGFNLVTLWRRFKADKAEKANVEIRLVDPTNKVRQIGKYELNFAPKIERVRSTVPWAGIKISSSGIYTFKLYLKEKEERNFKEAGETFLKVEILPASQVDQKIKEK